MKLTDRHILITGASRGIGKAWAKHLAAQGAQVSACGRNPAAMETEFAGTGIALHALDVNDSASCQALCAKLQETPLDILINNAGIFGPEVQSLHDADLEAFKAIYDTNVLGPIRVTQALYPLLRKSPEPLVVNISSGVGSIGKNVNGGILGYRMSKSAVNMFTKTLSIDEPEMTVVSLHPGWVRTDMGGSNADLSVEESIRSLTGVLASLTSGDSGKFFNFDGTPLPW